jgi:glyoxylase-like metal-dependent hydrolase (beta-lactamase superfamily II)
MAAPSPLVQTTRVGRLTVHAIQAGGQQLDGGAMFGVVPKPLWERKIPADARNRIPLGMRCLLVEHDDGLVLVDTGLGNKEDAKFHDIYGVENAGADGRTMLEDGLRALGHAPGDVRRVINTHLHFDHAGGNTYRDPSGAVELAFPNARYLVQHGELRYAARANERTSASYLAPNFAPIAKRDRFDEAVGFGEVVPGISVLPTPGHTPFHQSVLVESAGETLCFLGDVVPTSAHLPLPWIMGYDVEPLVTLESKRGLLRRAREEGWLLVFEHDARVAWGRVAHDGKQYRLAEEAPADVAHQPGTGPVPGQAGGAIA